MTLRGNIKEVKIDANMKYNDMFLLIFAFWINFAYGASYPDNDSDSSSSFSNCSTLDTTGTMIESDDKFEPELIAFGRTISPIPESFHEMNFDIKRSVSAPLPRVEEILDLEEIERPNSALPLVSIKQSQYSEEESESSLVSSYSDSLSSFLCSSSENGDNSSDSSSEDDFLSDPEMHLPDDIY